MTNKYNDFFRPYPIWFNETISEKEELKEGDIVTLRNGVFERKDSAREMTIEEISKELGYDVKVVKKK